MKKHKAHLALDTIAVFGKGVVEDTYNLLSEGLRQALRVVAEISAQTPEAHAAANDVGYYLSPSFEGTHSIKGNNGHEWQMVLKATVS